jgi:hypothetical protein
MDKRLAELLARNPRFRDFVDRYLDGSRYDPVSGEEALQRYAQVVQSLSEEEFLAAATEAFERMAPWDRARLVTYLEPRIGEINGRHDLEDVTPQELARATFVLEHEVPGGMGVLFLPDNPAQQSTAAQLNDPVVKSTLGGIAAYGLKRAIEQA